MDFIMHPDHENIAPPGQHFMDPAKPDIDPVSYALERLQTYLIWCQEHRASYVQTRDTNPRDAANEMNCLKDAIEQAILPVQRLTELILAGHGVDSKKKPPKGLCNEIWRRAVESLVREKQIEA
jgi:hypothetical protein